MTYLLDTSAFSALMKEDQRVRAWLSTLNENDRVVVCTIVAGEILYGIARLAAGRRRTEIQEKVRILFEAIPCEAIPESAASFYADIKLSRQRRGLTLDENDLWVAATARSLGAVLVTRDADFAGIDDLSTVTP